MTDKELRKLSRLELLELLLEAGKENRDLKEQIKRLEDENKTTQNIENLSAITCQVENALRYARSLAGTLETASGKPAASGNYHVPERESEASEEPLSDIDIYRHMLCFFALNADRLSVFPEDIEKAVRARLRSILGNIK